jgi:hypothetical protein
MKIKKVLNWILFVAAFAIAITFGLYAGGSPTCREYS